MTAPPPRLDDDVWELTVFRQNGRWHVTLTRGLLVVTDGPYGPACRWSSFSRDRAIAKAQRWIDRQEARERREHIQTIRYAPEEHR